MYTVPTDFARALEREFQGRLRVRWSTQRQEWHVEQKIRRGLADFPADPNGSDEHQRLRDGYMYILSIRPGDRMPCPRCASTLKVPHLEFREIICDFCKFTGKEYKVAAGYWPLNDKLIERLKELDPERSMTKVQRTQVDARNRALEEAQQKHVLNVSLGTAADDFVQITGIPMTGYTGKEFKG
jgi:hypothetical protein